VLTGDEAQDALGRALAGCGDVNLDGVPDLIGGLPDQPDPGAARVYSGVNGAILRSFVGLTPGDLFGRAVAGAGDVNLDGVPDLLVGAPRDDSTDKDAGRAVLFGGKTGTPLHEWFGEAPDDQLGLHVADAGDWNGDGARDQLLAVPGDDDAGDGAGSARVQSGLDGGELLHHDGASPGPRVEVVVAGLSDTNGDGRTEIAVAFPYDDAAATDAGLVQVLSGAAPVWADLGGGIAGVTGVPQLSGLGPLTPASPGALLLVGTPPFAPALMFLSFLQVAVPFKGGVLLAYPPIVQYILTTGPAGLSLPWEALPATLPPDLDLYFQIALLDAAAIKGVALTNLLLGTTLP
jgi:hypothetical protein